MNSVNSMLQRDPLAEAVICLAEAAIGREHLTLGEILEAVGSQGPSLAAALLVLPFLQPIPLMGLSSPMGLAIALLGVGIVRGREVKIPARIASVKLPVGSVLKLTECLGAFELKLKPYLKSETGPNSHTLSGGVRKFLGSMIVIHGALLALPLPIPFSNSMPAWMCFFAALTVLFSSRRLLIVSAALVLGNIIFWASLTIGAVWGSTSLVEWLGTKFT